MPDIPAWIDGVTELISGSIEWEGSGRLDLRFEDEPRRLFVAPCSVEWVGGAHDGTTVFPAFALSIEEIAQGFDKRPSIEWRTRDDEVVLSGFWQGKMLELVVRKQPFANEETAWAYQDGELRPRSK